jgi:iron complex transport system substrate-binding protein
MNRAPRIVSLISSATEILYGIGVGDRVVGVSHECDYPPQVVGKPRVTRSHVNAESSSREIDDQVRAISGSGAPLYEIDVDLLATLAPDLIVTQAQCDVCAVRYADVLEAVRGRPELAATQVVALNPTSLADVFDGIVRVGKAAGALEHAEGFRDTLLRRGGAITNLTYTLAKNQRPRVACVEWIEPLMLAANWTPEIVELAGGEHALTQGGVHSSYSSWSELVEYDPQVIIVMPCGFDLPRTLVEANTLTQMPGWDAINAVRSGRVWAVDGSAYFNRCGPRLVDSLEILAHLLHPDSIAPPTRVDAASAWRRLG